VRRAVVVLASLAASFAGFGKAAYAGDAHQITPDGHSVVAEVSRTTTDGAASSSAAGVDPAVPVVVCVSVPEVFAIFNGIQNIKFENGVLFRLYRRTCGTDSVWFWVGTTEFTDLVRTVRDRAIREVPPPAPSLIPSGVWQYTSWPTSILLPAGNTTVAPITASIPGFSITVTPTLSKVIFDPGDGNDPVICDVVPQHKDDCTYTYRHSSKDQPDLAYPATLSTTWALPYTVSTGATGTVTPAISLSVPLPIQVARIQVINV
jgi:hypothetical protein